MKQTVNFSQFCDAFKLMDRNGQFTYEGKRALFDYLENRTTVIKILDSDKFIIQDF